MKKITITIELCELSTPTIKETILEQIETFKKNRTITHKNNLTITHEGLDKMIDPIRNKLNEELGEKLWNRPTTYDTFSIYNQKYVGAFFKFTKSPYDYGKGEIIVAVKTNVRRLSYMEYVEYEEELEFFLKIKYPSSTEYRKISFEEISKVHEVCKGDYLEYFTKKS